MKPLLIMRHAKSDYPPDVRSDFDRPLNAQGRKDVPLVGKLLNNSARNPTQYRPRQHLELARLSKAWRRP